MFQPQLKHKAKHGNYRDKPTKGEVLGLMSLYSGVSDMVLNKKPVKKQIGVQLRLEF